MALMRRGFAAACAGLVVSLGVLACGNGSPAAPTAAPVVPAVTTPVISVALLTAAPVSPAQDAVVDYRSTPVNLIATVPTPPTGALIIDTFEHDDNAGFTSPTVKDVPRQAGSTTLPVYISNNQVDKNFYWRVRSASGELKGPYSETFRFKVAAEGLRPPIPLEPAAGAIIAARPKLRVTKVLHGSTGTSWTYEFEVGADEVFRSIVARGRVGENITSVVSFTPDADLPAARYFWRARTLDSSGQASDFTAPWPFDVSEPFAATPIPVSPSPGAVIPQPATFVLRNGPIFTSSTGTRYEVQLSVSPSFVSVAKAGLEWPDAGGTTTVTVTTNLPGGTYYWRARSIALRDTTRPDLASAWTDPRPVTLAGLVLGTPQVVSPVDFATTSLRPTLTVSNVTRSGPGGTLAYRFEVSTDSQFVSAPAAVASVAEGAGSTSWTLPFDLPVGVRFWWRVRASEAASGTTSAFSSIARFAAVDSRTHLYALTLGIPVSCGFLNRTPALFAQSEDVPGGTRFRLVSQDADQNTGDSLVLDVTRDATGAVSGTLLGSATLQNRAYVISSAQNSSAPAIVTGTVAGFTMSGTIDGRVRESAYPASSASCATPVLTWSVSPRTQ